MISPVKASGDVFQIQFSLTCLDSTKQNKTNKTKLKKQFANYEN